MFDWLRRSRKVDVRDECLRFRLGARDAQRRQARCDNNAKMAQRMCRKALEDNNTIGARHYAETCMRHRRMRDQYQVLSNKLLALEQRLQYAMSVNEMSSGMKRLARGMVEALQVMDVGKLNESIELFEANFGNLDKAMDTVERGLSVASPLEPVDYKEVDDIVEEAEDVLTLSTESQMAVAPERSVAPVSSQKRVAIDSLELEKRMQQLMSG